MSTNYTDMGNTIRTFRERKGVTQEALAERLGVDRKAVSKMECGLTNPHYDTLIKYAEALDIPFGLLATTDESRTRFLAAWDEILRLPTNQQATLFGIMEQATILAKNSNGGVNTPLKSKNWGC